METITLASLLTDIGSIVTASVSWLQTAATAIASNPIALLFILLPMLGVGISLFGRIIHLN